MAKYTEERMFGMLTDIDRSEKRNAYKKYDLPTFKNGGNNTCPPNSYWNGTKCVTIPQKGISISDPDDYAYRKDMYDDSLSLYNYTKLQKKLEKPFHSTSHLSRLFGNPSLTKQGKKNQEILQEEVNKILKENPEIKLGDPKNANEPLKIKDRRSGDLISNPEKNSYKNYAKSGSWDIYHPKIKMKGKWQGIAQNNDYSNVKPIQPVFFQSNNNPAPILPIENKVNPYTNSKTTIKYASNLKEDIESEIRLKTKLLQKINLEEAEIIQSINKPVSEPTQARFGYRQQAVYEYDKDTKKFSKDSSRKAPLPYAEKYSGLWEANSPKDLPESGFRVWILNGKEYYNQEDAKDAAKQYEELPSYNFQFGGEKEAANRKARGYAEGCKLDKFVGGGLPGDKYYKNNGEQYKKTNAGQWFVWNPTYKNWEYADSGFHNNIDLEKYKASYASDDASWENDKPKSNVAKPGTVPYYEEQRNKTLNSPLASYEQKMKATNSPLASNVAIRNNLTAQKAAEEAKVAAEKAKAEKIASWYEQEKQKRIQDALMFGNNPVQVSDATRVDVDYLAPIVGEFRRAEADKQRQEDEVFTSQEKVLKRGFKNIYDYENDPMGRGYDEALAAEERWRASGAERPMIDRGEMSMYQNNYSTPAFGKNAPDFSAGYNSESGYYNTPQGKYNTRTGQFEPTPQYYSGSGALQGVDWLWTLPFAAPAAIEAIGSLGALQIPGMYGATLGNAVNAGFIGHGLHSLPNTGASWYDAYKEGKGDYRDALGNTMWNAVDFVGIGEGAGLKSVAQDVKQAGKYLTTKTPLKNVHNYNPLAGKLGEYNRVVGEDAIADLQNSGLVRAGNYGGVRQKFGNGIATRQTPYPSFGQGSPRNTYIQQTIEQGKTPYIISTDRAMETSTLGRHGKGSTKFPVDESGNFIESFPASEVNVFEGTPNWLTGYKPISTETVSLGNLESTGAMASENAGMFSSASSTPDLKAFRRDPSKQYVRVNQKGMDDFLAQNPGKKVDVIRQDDWPGVLNSEGIAMTDPLNQTRTLQKSEFDQATEFGTKWAVADPVAYQKVMDEIAFVQKRKTALLNSGDNAMTKMETLQNQWLDDYVKQNPSKTAKQLKDEYETLKNSNQDVASSEYYQALSKAIQDNVATSPEIKALYNDAASLQNTVQRLDSQIKTLEKSTDPLLDPTFKNKIEIIYDAAGKPMPTNPTPVDISRRSSLVYGSESEPSFLNLPLEDQQYLIENWRNIGGARTGNKTITLGSRPEETVRFLEKPALQWEQGIEYEKYPFSINDPKTWKNAFKKSETGYDRKLIEADPSEINPIQIDKQSMVVPETVGEIQAHEVGHDLQKFEEAWIDNLQEYRPDLEYYTGHNRNPLAKEFNEAMVNPTAPVPNPMKPGSTKQSSETWKSSVGELHSELMLARYKAAKHFMSKPYAEGALTMDEAIAAVKKLEAEGDQALFDFYLDTAGGNLTKHFKGETEDSIKKLLIQILPGVVPAAVVGAGMSASESGVPENRYGGNIKNLSKFIKK